ncbi:MAG TPA: zf-HC2 domain-containing protein, partial [Pirellulales bacterium]|nr:zf-HC2 domain-containing protein [Pirellulales bacterium]
MSDESDDILSAYLDGELNADERAAVEARLAADPASQALVDDLRRCRQQIRALPRAALGRDFADRVLRRAERQMLAPDSGATIVGGATADALRDRPATLLRLPRGRRPWVYAGLAIAAALLVMFTSQLDRVAPRLDQVAQNRPLPQGELIADSPTTSAATAS